MKRGQAVLMNCWGCCGGGRIRPADCKTDDTTTPITEGVSINAAHVAAIQTTELKGMKNNCRRDYRNHNKQYV